MKYTKDNVDTMILCGSHSIMTSHLPKNLNGQIFSDKFFEAAGTSKDSIESFGLFGANTDYNTYYPEADSSQFNPSEDEFIEPVFRMLSNCIVAKNYNPTEFPSDVLKASMNLLVGQTINCDHETEIGNAIGSVKSVSWQEAYTDKETGIHIPAGINGVFRIDAKANPRIARGINMDPPSIHSNSVTVMFEWKPSHQFEKEWEFYDKLGSIAEDGTIVRRIATRIICYKETSLVSHGADPFAQIIRNGKLNNPKYAGAVYYSFSDLPPMEFDDLKSKMSLFDFKGVTEIDTMYNTNKPNNISYKTSNSNNHTNMDKLQEFLDSLFGTELLNLAEGTKPSVELVLSEVKAIIAEKTSLAEAKVQLESQVASLSDEVKSLKIEIQKNEAMATIGTSHLSAVRNSAVESYTKLMGEKVDQNILTLLNAETTGLETLLSLKATYDVQLEEKFPMACTKCGCTEISRASSVMSNDTEGAATEDNLSDQSVADSIRKMAEAKLK